MTSIFPLLLLYLHLPMSVPRSQTCDLKFYKVTTRWDLPTHSVQLFFASKNDTPKVVVGAKFGVYTLDAVKDKHEYPLALVNEYKHKPGKDVADFESLSLIGREDAEGGAIVWVQKVLYADGTTWEDDGSRSCQIATK